MKDFGKVVGIHLGIFALYSIFSGLLLDQGLFLSFWVSLVHGLVALILGIIFLAKGEETRMAGFGHLAGMLLVIIIGFSACLVAMSNMRW